MPDQPTDLKARWEQNKAQFERLCDEQEGLYNPEFERVFTALYEIAPDQREVYNTNGWNIFAELPEATDTEKIEQALQAVEVVGAVADDFKHYAEVVLQGKRLQQENMLLNLKIEDTNQPRPEPQPEGWRFYPISIFAPVDLHTTIVEEIDRQAQHGEGLYGNTTEVKELPDEFLDELLGVEVYNVECSYLPYYTDLVNYGVIGTTLTPKFKYNLFTILKELADHIKANTDKPEAVKTHILQAVQAFDDMPIWGLIFQIMILQGLCALLENCTLSEGDRGYNEAACLYEWLQELLADKLIKFILTPYGEGDKQRLKPLCDYLYNTEIGRTVQECIFKRPQPEANHLNEPTDTPEPLRLPDGLNTPEALKYFAQARELGLIDDDYKWLKGLQLLACFAREMSIKLGLGKGTNSDGTPRVGWRPFETLFKIDKGKLRANYNDVQKTGQQPTGCELIDEIFN